MGSGVRVIVGLSGGIPSLRLILRGVDQITIAFLYFLFSSVCDMQ